MITVSVIIVNWNSKEFVREALTSLFKYSDKHGLEVIVVDSGSFDGCDRMLAAEFPTVRYLQSPDNVGFARANNLAEAVAQGEYLLFLNPDTVLLEDTVAKLRAYLEHHRDVGAVGPRLLNGDRSLQTSCVQTFPTALNQAIDSEFLRRRFPQWPIWGIGALASANATAVEALSGACIMMPRQIFRQIGGFTADYFMYGEDIDLCYKVHRAGARVMHLPETRLVHLGGGSSSKAPSAFSTVAMRESMYTFLRRNRGIPAASLYRAATAASALLRLIVTLPLLAVRSSAVQHGRYSLAKWWTVAWWAVGVVRAPRPTLAARLDLSAQPST